MPGTPARPPRPGETGTGRTWPRTRRPGIITGEKLTKAAGEENSDPAVAGEFLAAEAGHDNPGPAAAQGTPPARDADGGPAGPGPDTAGHGTGTGGKAGGDSGEEPLAWDGDSAYGTGDLRGAIAGAGHAAVIKPRPLQAPVAGGLTVDDFAEPDPDRRLRRGLPGLPAAPAVPRQQDRPQARPAPPR